MGPGRPSRSPGRRRRPYRPLRAGFPTSRRNSPGRSRPPPARTRRRVERSKPRALGGAILGDLDRAPSFPGDRMGLHEYPERPGVVRDLQGAAKPDTPGWGEAGVGLCPHPHFGQRQEQVPSNFRPGDRPCRVPAPPLGQIDGVNPWELIPKLERPAFDDLWDPAVTIAELTRSNHPSAESRPFLTVATSDTFTDQIVNPNGLSGSRIVVPCGCRAPLLKAARGGGRRE